MTDGPIRAVLAAERDGPPGRLAELDLADLPGGEVTVRVRYSSLNYKDGLAVTGKGPVVRTFPMVCGVDLAGTVEQSSWPTITPGDEVIVTGFGLGEDHFGGFADLARVKARVGGPAPARPDARQAMAIGTAGLTAMLCVMALEREGLTPESPGDMPVAVTGAAGGVGSVAVAILAGLGYKVAAVSGRPEEEGYLRSFGASEVIPRAELSEAPPKALEKETYAGAVDVVGGTTLATLIRRIRYRGCVAACGLTGGAELNTTVHPVHPPERHPRRRGLGPLSGRAPQGRLEPPRHRATRRHPRRHDGRAPSRGRARARRADRRRQDARPGRDRRQPLSGEHPSSTNARQKSRTEPQLVGGAPA